MLITYSSPNKGGSVILHLTLIVCICFAIACGNDDKGTNPPRPGNDLVATWELERTNLDTIISSNVTFYLLAQGVSSDSATTTVNSLLAEAEVGFGHFFGFDSSNLTFTLTNQLIDAQGEDGQWWVDRKGLNLAFPAEEYYCSNDGEDYAEQMGGILCPDTDNGTVPTCPDGESCICIDIDGSCEDGDDDWGTKEGNGYSDIISVNYLVDGNNLTLIWTNSEMLDDFKVEGGEGWDEEDQAEFDMLYGTDDIKFFFTRR